MYETDSSSDGDRDPALEARALSVSRELSESILEAEVVLARAQAQKVPPALRLIAIGVLMGVVYGTVVLFTLVPEAWLDLKAWLILHPMTFLLLSGILGGVAVAVAYLFRHPTTHLSRQLDEAKTLLAELEEELARRHYL